MYRDNISKKQKIRERKIIKRDRNIKEVTK